MVAFYDNQPTKLEAVGNGSFVYRFNIQKVENPAPAETDGVTAQAEAPVKEQWKCEEVTVWSPLSSNKITEKVITENGTTIRNRNLSMSSTPLISECMTAQRQVRWQRQK